MMFRKTSPQGDPDASRHEAVRPQPPGRIEGYIDVVGDACVIGWAYDPDNPFRKLKIEISAGYRVVVVLADLDRPDLRAAGKGDGFCGFHADFAFDDVQATPVHVRESSTGTDLTGSPFDPDPVRLLASPLNRSRLERLRWEVQRTSLALKGVSR